jgi:hypothetical protein
MKKYKLKKAQTYIYMFLLLALSGNPFFNYSEGFYQNVFAGFICLMIIKHHTYFNIKRAKYFYFIILFFIGIFFFQKMVLGFISITTTIGFLLKIILGYILIRFVGPRFRIVYFEVIYYLSVISLIGYMWNSFGFDIPNILNDSKLKSIIFFTQQVDGSRNSGMFWEPGAFACYICLGLVLNLKNLIVLSRNHRKKIVFILLALITTFSTTGYIALFMIITFILFFKYRREIRFIPMYIILFFMANYIYQTSSFLNEKINHQIEISQSTEIYEFSPDRFRSFIFDLKYISKHPLIGNGLNQKTRYKDHEWMQNQVLGHGNGFSNFLACMGTLSLLFLFFLIFKFNKQYPTFFIIMITVLLQGQQLLDYPLFLGLPFIFIYEYQHSRSLNLS